MGVAPSVPVMRGNGRTLAFDVPPRGAGSQAQDLGGDRAFPTAFPLAAREVQQVYLDNWDAFLILTESQTKLQSSSPSASQKTPVG